MPKANFKNNPAVQTALDIYAQAQKKLKKMQQPSEGTSPLTAAIMGGIGGAGEAALNLFGSDDEEDLVMNAVMGSVNPTMVGPATFGAVLGARLPTLYHGTKATIKTLLEEGFDMGRLKVSDILGAMVHSIPNKQYARSFAPVNSNPEDILLALKARPDSKVINLSNSTPEQMTNYGWPTDIPQEDPSLIQSMLSRFKSPQGSLMDQKADLVDQLKYNPDVLKDYDIQHVLYDDASVPALATRNPQDLILAADETRRLTPFNITERDKNLLRMFDAGPYKGSVESGEKLPGLEQLFHYDVGKLRQIGGQGGSNPGGKFANPNVPSRHYYIKSPPAHFSDDEAIQIVQNEMLAQAAEKYLRIGEVGQFNIGRPGIWNDRPALVTPWMSNLQEPKGSFNDLTQLEPSTAVNEYLKDIVLRNWDVAEPGNRMINSYGEVVRPDLGGALFRRAQGKLKPGNFATDVIDDLDNMLDTDVNPKAAELYRLVRAEPGELKRAAREASWLNDAHLYANYPSGHPIGTTNREEFGRMGNQDLPDLLTERIKNIKKAILGY